MSQPESAPSIRTEKPEPKDRFFLVRLTAAVADELEEVQHFLRRHHQRPVTKRQLVETALKRYLRKIANELD
jgi:hypothetical protein